MHINHSVSEARIILTERLVAANQAVQTAKDELKGIHRHFRLNWSYDALYPIQQKIQQDIADLWAMSDEDVKARYKQHVGVRVMD